MRHQHLLATLLAITLANCSVRLPKPTVTEGEGFVIVGIQTLAEYPTAVRRVRLTDTDEGRIIWEAHSTFDTPKIWKIRFAIGDNSISLGADGEYKTIVPDGSSHFEVLGDRNYRIEFWGPQETDKRQIDFSVSTGTQGYNRERDQRDIALRELPT